MNISEGPKTDPRTCTKRMKDVRIEVTLELGRGFFRPLKTEGRLSVKFTDEKVVLRPE